MLAERRITEEIMDDPELPPQVYDAVLADLAKVNRLTMAHRPTLNFLERCVGGRDTFTLLDVGYGHGDMLREISAWAQKRGIKAQLTGIDLNPKSEAAARAATNPALPITYKTGDYQDFDSGFDVIVSSLVAHHMTHSQLLAFLRFMDSEAQQGWFINDLHRHTFSYLGYPLLARLMGWHGIVRKDGQTSIARSYRPQEWQDMLAQANINGAQVERFFPFRLCVSWLK